MDFNELVKKKGYDTLGAEAVLENYLNGALYDLEQGDVINYDFVFTCIIGLDIIYRNKKLPFGFLLSQEFKDRFMKSVPKEWIENK